MFYEIDRGGNKGGERGNDLSEEGMVAALVSFVSRFSLSLQGRLSVEVPDSCF
jgi:hypothetical protein